MMGQRIWYKNYIEDDSIAMKNMRALRQCRENTGTTIKALAHAIDIWPSALGYYERAPQYTPVAIYNKLAKILAWTPYQCRETLCEKQNRVPILRDTRNTPRITGDPVAEANIKELRTQRHEKGWTQYQVAVMARLSSNSYVGHIELGKTICPVIVYNRLADLFGWEEYPTKKFLREKKLRRTFGKNYKETKR